MATDREILVALAALVSGQVGSTVTPVRLGRAIQRGLGRLAEQTYTVPQANRWARTNPDSSRNYVARVGGGRSVELHCWPVSPTSPTAAGAVLHLYSGTPDATSDAPLDGLTWYWQETVDPAAVPDDTTAWAWLTTRVAAGLPAAP